MIKNAYIGRAVCDSLSLDSIFSLIFRWWASILFPNLSSSKDVCRLRQLEPSKVVQCVIESGYLAQLVDILSTDNEAF